MKTGRLDEVGRGGPEPAPSEILHIHQRIIGLSANSDDETTEAAFQAGIDAFIAKPFKINDFDRIIAHMV
jgi:CheY-like chemotaxis protein